MCIQFLFSKIKIKITEKLKKTEIITEISILMKYYLIWPKIVFVTCLLQASS